MLTAVDGHGEAGSAERIAGSHRVQAGSRHTGLLELRDHAARRPDLGLNACEHPGGQVVRVLVGDEHGLSAGQISQVTEDTGIDEELAVAAAHADRGVATEPDLSHGDLPGDRVNAGRLLVAGAYPRYKGP